MQIMSHSSYERGELFEPYAGEEASGWVGEEGGHGGQVGEAEGGYGCHDAA